jgi:transcriptional regulator GlxA family with amidase domain
MPAADGRGRNDSQSGPLYLEALARELTLSMLIRVHDNAQKDGQVRKVNPSILRSIEQMKECFAKRLCVQEMAVQAGMSRRQFTAVFCMLLVTHPTTICFWFA